MSNSHAASPRPSLRILGGSPALAILAEDAGPAGAVARVLAVWMRRLGDGSPRTAQSYGREAREFLAFIERARGPLPGGLLAVTPADVAAFVHAIADLAPATRAIKCAVLRSLFGALVLEGLLPINPAAEVRVRHVQSGRHHRAVPQSQIITTLERLAQSQTLRDIRDRALLLLTLAVAARRFEISALNVGSIEPMEDVKASISFTGKGQKVAKMTIKAGVVDAINAWLLAGGHSGDHSAPLFFNLSHRPEHSRRRISGGGIRLIIKRLFPRYSPHGLRARSITDVWSRSAGNLGHAQAFARHSSPSTTEKIYIQADKLEKALEFTYDYA